MQAFRPTRLGTVHHRRDGGVASRVRRLLPVLSLALGLVGIPTPAGALPSELPDPTWHVNGTVWAITKHQDTVFIGGDFTQLREKPVGVDGGQVIPVNNFAALDANTGAALPVMSGNPPDFVGTKDVIYALTMAGGRLWAGGRFQTVDGGRRFNIAAIDPITLGLEAPNPRMNRIVWALASDGTKVYAGGKFDKVNGQPRPRLAALSLNGALDPDWTPSADDKVADMAVTPDGTGLFITGVFRSVRDPDGDAHDRNAIARLNTTTGNVTSWLAGGGPYSPKIRGAGVNTDGDRLYWAVAQSDWAAAFHIDTGQRIFKTDTDGTVNDAVEMGDRVIIGGHFLLVAPQPGISGCATFPDRCERRVRIAALSLNGVLDPNWTPVIKGEWQGPKRLLVDGDKLWIAGAFTRISDVKQSYIGRLS